MVNGKLNSRDLLLIVFILIFNSKILTVYSFDGLVVLMLLVICTCSYIRRIPKLKQWFLSEKKGFAGIFYKG